MAGGGRKTGEEGESGLTRPPSGSIRGLTPNCPLVGERKRPAYGKIPGPIRRDSALLANKKAVWPERAGFESHQCRSPLDRSL